MVDWISFVRAQVADPTGCRSSCCEKLAPTPSTRSALLEEHVQLLRDGPPAALQATSDRSPGKALFPSRLVVTGASSSSARIAQLAPGPRVVHALPGVQHRALGGDEQRRGLLDRLRIRARCACGSRADSGAGRRPPRRERSVGNSTMHGPGRPFRAWVKARRTAFPASPATLTCSSDLVTWAKLLQRAEVGLDPW